MHPLVRDLYKRFMLVGLDYPHPEGLGFVRRKVKAGFQENAHLQDEVSSAINYPP
jgi:Complex 1 protein (LYR family)